MTKRNEKLQKSFQKFVGISSTEQAVKIEKEAERLAHQEVLQIKNYDGFQFERYLGRLLTKLNFSNVEVTSKSDDQGIDATGELNGVYYGFQCKHYKNKVGNRAVQEAYYGIAFYHLDKGIVINNNNFSNSVIELAKATNIELWNRDCLEQLIKKSKKGGCIK